MDKYYFKNWDAMLNTLPGLEQLSNGLVEDAQNSEPHEVLLRRLGVLAQNVSCMSEASMRLPHVPQLVEPLVDALQDLNKLVAYSNKNAPSANYEGVIQMICNVHMNVVTLTHCANEVSTMLANLPRLERPHYPISP